MTNFSNDERGSVAMMAGLMIGVMAIGAVAAIDYTAASQLRASAQRALDSAALSCARSGGPCDTNLFATNFGQDADRFDGEPEVSLEVVDDRVEGSAKFTVNSSMITGVSAIFGQMSNLTDVSVSTVVSVQSPSKEELGVSEIVLVLDVSASMRHEIDDLREAAADLVTRLHAAGDPKVSIIPFATGVRFPVNQGFERYLKTSTCTSKSRCDDPSVWNGCFAPESYASIAAGDMAVDRSLEWMGDKIKNSASIGEKFPFCSPATSEALFFSDDEAAIVDHINNLELGFGTGTETGLIWAWRALFDNYDMPMRNGVEPAEGRKAVFVFSDGLVTDMHDVAKVRKGGKKAAVQATLDICALFRNHPDADIYTSFYSDRGAKSRDEGASLMSGCAEDLDNFWDVEKASDIPDAFQSFGDSIMKVSTKRPSIIH